MIINRVLSAACGFQLINHHSIHNIQLIGEYANALNSKGWWWRWQTATIKLVNVSSQWVIYIKTITSKFYYVVCNYQRGQFNGGGGAI